MSPPEAQRVGLVRRQGPRVVGAKYHIVGPQTRLRPGGSAARRGSARLAHTLVTPSRRLHRRLAPMSRTKEQEWGDSPRLNTWRAAQQAAFETWAEETGGIWDFTPDSVDRLEEAMRGRYFTWDEVSEAEDGPFLSLASWYLGEVQVRTYGAIWQW